MGTRSRTAQHSFANGFRESGLAQGHAVTVAKGSVYAQEEMDPKDDKPPSQQMQTPEMIGRLPPG